MASKRKQQDMSRSSLKGGDTGGQDVFGEEYEQRTTTGIVTALNDDEIFVFGSNEAGRHGKGAAKIARQWGAVYGQAEGLQGQTYGIPTKDSKVKNALSVGKIQKYVDRFIEFANENPQLHFLVTEIGCGLSGYTAADIAPLFEDALFVDSISLPATFWQVLAHKSSAVKDEK